MVIAKLIPLDTYNADTVKHQANVLLDGPHVNFALVYDRDYDERVELSNSLHPLSIWVASELEKTVTVPITKECKRCFSAFSTNIASLNTSSMQAEGTFESKSLGFDVLINCNARINSIDFGKASPDDSAKILMVVSTQPMNEVSATNPEFYTFVHIYSISYWHKDASAGDEDTFEISLSHIIPIKNDFCTHVRIINQVQDNDSQHFFVLALLLDSGAIKIGRIETSEFAHVKSKTDDLSERILNLDIIWEYDPKATSSKLCCFDVTYPSDDDSVGFIIASGSMDGFVRVWHFKRDIFKEKDLDSDPCTFSKLISVIQDTSSVSASVIVSICFIQTLDAYIAAIGTFSKSIILWDIRYSHLYGEIKTYHNVTKPVNALSWTKNNQYLLGCTSSGFYIDWLNNSTNTTINIEKYFRTKLVYPFENICWDVHCSDTDAHFVFDDGIFLSVPSENIGRRNMEDIFTLYKWNLLDYSQRSHIGPIDVKEGANFDDSIKELIVKTFDADLASARKHGITIVKFKSNNYESFNFDEKTSDQVVRSKLTSHKTVCSFSMDLTRATLGICAYGGNCGVAHVMLNIELS
ncbi:hypothetical protein BEWA_031680 [Theileria equi strain WA]|uniref:Uncharacterized protein n=1 Tax=Theileria equi strain WA TaxID=1537102 RepID=L0AXM5_THEEQ|nr:hypothetical protein BEWA_031680 [Theileria equi strain WA]AFZ80315.1 hypothetical protein BEWA_031680 [Theileria equi strain WA]|eukprot:XP_004829981.1 hypothetical protein BEWA_031680 [Theileria equi strain WA]